MHVTCSVGWHGAAAAYLGLVVAALTRQDAQVVRAAYLAMEPITWFAIVPLAIASVLTGLVESFGTQWGLFRHYWVLFKFVLTVLATAVLLGTPRRCELWQPRLPRRPTLVGAACRASSFMRLAACLC